MAQFNINNVIKRYKLDTNDLAKVLFPWNKYPDVALARVLKGEGSLSITQVETLANHIGISVSDLYSTDLWKSASENGYLTFIKGPYKVKVGYNHCFACIFKDEKPIRQIFFGKSSMTIDEFIDFINEQIQIYENGDN